MHTCPISSHLLTHYSSQWFHWMEIEIFRGKMTYQFLLIHINRHQGLSTQLNLFGSKSPYNINFAKFRIKYTQMHGCINLLNTCAFYPDVDFRNDTWIGLHIIFNVTIGSKIPFTSKGGRLCEGNLLRYLALCYVNRAYHKLNRLWINQKLQEIVFAQSVTFGVKGILLPFVHSFP